jgi:peroxiredoxin family protein
MKDKPRFVIFAHNAGYDKLHQVGTLGLTAAAMSKDVTVVLLFWTILRHRRAIYQHGEIF